MKIASGIRWGRVLIAVLAAHLANAAVAVLLITVYSLAASVTQANPGGGLAEPLASRAAVWPLPVMTFVAAAWATRGTSGPTALLHGLLVGGLVAAGFGLLYFWPFSPGTLAPFALAFAVALPGSAIGRRL
ncbi:MAG: hypothetical protein IN808_09355 [Rubrobacter sp.]|nr:hypothetical protein [Rubrobacter sp.]